MNLSYREQMWADCGRAVMGKGKGGGEQKRLEETTTST